MSINNKKSSSYTQEKNAIQYQFELTILKKSGEENN